MIRGLLKLCSCIDTRTIISKIFTPTAIICIDHFVKCFKKKPSIKSNGVIYSKGKK